jgi:hypothetical protein
VATRQRRTARAKRYSFVLRVVTATMRTITLLK